MPTDVSAGLPRRRTLMHRPGARRLSGQRDSDAAVFLAVLQEGQPLSFPPNDRHRTALRQPSDINMKHKSSNNRGESDPALPGEMFAR